jgi:hypothetical protein
MGSCHRSGDERLFGLAGSAIERLSRALRARDRMQEQLRLRATSDTQEEALFYFDVVLLMLAAALDVVARVAHRIYGLPARGYRGASWRSDEWRTTLRDSTRS